MKLNHGYNRKLLIFILTSIFLLFVPVLTSQGKINSELLSYNAKNLLHIDGESESIYGESITGIGDYNHDGFQDFLVGGRMWGGWRGKAWIYFGSANGINGNTPAFTIEGDPLIAGTGGCFGHTVSGNFDINHDGIPDFIVGNPGSWSAYDIGKIYVFYGNQNNFPSTAKEDANITIVSPQKYDWLSESLDSAGDFNGDGYVDLVAGAPGSADSLFENGLTYIFLGTPNGVSTSPNITLSNNIKNSDFGMEVSGIGDINNDGYDDIMVTARKFSQSGTEDQSGQAYIYFGGQSVNSTLSPNITINAPDINKGFGYNVISAGDLNGDSYNDFAISSYREDVLNTESNIYIYFGGLNKSYASPDLTLKSVSPQDAFGRTLTSIGDINHDGFDDIAIGAPGEPNNVNDTGHVYIYYGNSNMDSNPDISINGEVPKDRFGYAIGVTDLNSDGDPELIMSAIGHTATGRIYVFGLNFKPTATTNNASGFELSVFFSCLMIYCILIKFRRNRVDQ